MWGTDGEECDLPVSVDGFCIGHSPNSTKSVSDFLATLQYCLTEDKNGVVNLSGFHFPPQADLPQSVPQAMTNLRFEGCTFHGTCQWKDRNLLNVQFDGSIFEGDLRLTKVGFDGHVSFKGATFRGDVVLTNCRFGTLCNLANSVFCGSLSLIGGKAGDRVSFRTCEFRSEFSAINFHFLLGADFSGCRWLKKAEIKGCAIGGKTSFNASESRGIDFDQTSFLSEVTFDSARFLAETVVSSWQFEKHEASFEDTDMSYCILDVNSSDEIEHFNLAGVTWKVPRKTPKWLEHKWPALPRWLTNILPEKYYRFKTIELKDQLVLMRTYEQYYEKRLRFREAGLFYVRAMETQRRLDFEEMRPLNWLFGSLYGLLSRHGESVARPFLWMVAVFMASTLALHLGGIWSQANSQSTTDFVQSLQINFSLLAPGKVSATDYFHSPWQLALLSAEIFALITILSFLIAALRRRFKRRSVGPSL
jgi:uncharacterized protein YjbI with pentapeptide repeats